MPMNGMPNLCFRIGKVSRRSSSLSGEAASEEDYAQEMLDDNGLLNEVPEPLRSYFDFEAYARDLFSSGYVFHDGYVFSN